MSRTTPGQAQCSPCFFWEWKRRQPKAGITNLLLPMLLTWRHRLVAESRSASTRQDKTTTPFRKQATLIAVDYYRKKCLSLEEVNISQSETALCSAVLAQKWFGCHGTFSTLASTWAPAVGRRQSPLGASQHAKKKRHAEHQTRNRVLH